jgi:hypothetical protein
MVSIDFDFGALKGEPWEAPLDLAVVGGRHIARADVPN